MKKKIINGILAAAILIAAPSAFVSCKDNDADLRTELLGKIADLKKQLDDIQLKAGPKGDQGEKGDKGDPGKDGSVVTIGENGNWFIDGVDTKVPAKGEKGDKGDPGENANVVEIGENGNWFINGKDTGVPATGEKGKDGKDGANSISIGENGNWFINGEDTGIPATGPKGDQGDKGVNPVLVEGDDGHWYWWLDGVYTGVRADGDGATIGGDKWTVGPGATWYINGEDTGILAYNYDQMVKLIKDQIYNAERDGLTPELEAEIRKLLENLNESLEKSIQNLVTSVIAERTENSLYGQLAIPGWNPLILAAYYGSTGSNVIFPEDDINVTGAEKFRLGAGQEIKGDGGKIYVTLNPNEVAEDYIKEVSLVSSTDKAAPFTMSALTKSNAELTFGWNRTRAGNGLYEATAELNSASAAGINVHSDILKEDAKALLDEIRTGAVKNSIKSLANLMADAFTDAIETLPAYTVKTTWTDPLLGQKTVRSGYDIAAFSVKPLAYDFEYSATLDVKPFVDKIQYFFDKVIDKVNIQLSLGLGTVKKIEIKDVDLSGKTITVTIPEQYVFDPLTNTYTGDIIKEQTLTINMDAALVPAAEEITKAIKSLEELNDLIDKINNIDANINSQIASTKEALKAQIHDYLSVLVNKINSAVGSVSLNKIIQPTLLVKSNAGISRATGSYNGTIKLLPTSYTAELLAPAYKKFVVITEIDGNPATAADNTGDLGKVLDGGVQEVEFTPAAGKTYTIAYSALDYFGNIVTNYYVISGK